VAFNEPGEIKAHFEIAPYVHVSNAGKWKEMRRMYFDYLAQEINKVRPLTSDTKVLDIGCSFGHLLESFQLLNARCYGVEIVDSTREYAIASHPDFKIFESLASIPDYYNFDIVTMIDVLYYLDDPLDYMISLNARLEESGLLLLRVTNRAWLISLLRKLNISLKYDYFSDAKYLFTDNTMRLLLQKSGFIILKSFSTEKGKKFFDLSRFLFYKFSPISRLLGFNPTLFIACTSAYDFAPRTVNNTTIRQATRSSASG
jgi:SAM-dependent methyltransferase